MCVEHGGGWRSRSGKGLVFEAWRLVKEMVECRGVERLASEVGRAWWESAGVRQIPEGHNVVDEGWLGCVINAVIIGSGGGLGRGSGWECRDVGWGEGSMELRAGGVTIEEGQGGGGRVWCYIRGWVSGLGGSIGGVRGWRGSLEGKAECKSFVGWAGMA